MDRDIQDHAVEVATPNQNIADSDAVLAEEEESAQSVPTGCAVVGIGASAGGLEAFTQFLDSLSPNTGMAYVLVQHLDPRHESILATLLASHTTMPVVQASQEVVVEPDHVYVIPPNTSMAIDDGRLRLTPRPEDRNRYMPIDFFLCSLAQSQRSRSIGVILSGAASDGTVGLKAIKAEGGITFVQDKSARFDGMPGSAIAAGAVDFILPPQEIAKELGGIARHSYVVSPQAPTPIDDAPVLSKIITILRQATGADFTHYKSATIQRRMSRRMALHQTSRIEDYLALLERDPVEVQALFEDLLITVTEFFRDPETFDAIKAKVMPEVIKNHRTGEPIRVWVAGCSSGEEVYSLAIIILEYLETRGLSFPVQIFGTDLSEQMVGKARAGQYPESATVSVSPERLQRFFVKTDFGYQIARGIREICVFSRQDVTRDPPLSKMDLISCRNLMIYLGPILQRRVMAIFNYALHPAGCLVLGHSENIGPMASHFLPLDREHRIFCRNLHSTQPTFDIPTRAQNRSTAAFPEPKKIEPKVGNLDMEADAILLDEYAPSGFVVRDDNHVLSFRGKVGPFLDPAAGEATFDVSKLVREDIWLHLKSALTEAAFKQVVVRNENIQVKRNGSFQEINLVVRPMGTNQGGGTFLVSFEEIRQKNSGSMARVAESEPGERSNELAEELDSTRRYLQSLIEELRSANEEAQSANEELQSTNEELQTAKEELQSSNEELTTMNEEMQSRNGELSEVNNDLLNLLSSLQVPILMLSRDLRVRRFTPVAGRALSLIATDVGRPISDLRLRIDLPNFEQLITSVIDSAESLEREVRDKDGHWYSLRISPYRTAERRIDGAVVQLLDIDQLKITMEEVEAARSYSETVLATVREPLVVLDENLKVRTANESYYKTFEVTAEQTVGHPFFALTNGQWKHPKIEKMLREVTSGSHDGESVEVERDFERIGWRPFQISSRRFQEGKAHLVLLALEDITDRKRAAEAKYRRLFESAKDGIVIADALSGEMIDANPFVSELLGYSRTELLGTEFWKAESLHHLAPKKEILKTLQEKKVVRFDDLTMTAQDGHRVDTEVVANVYSEGERQVIQFNIRDITERKQFEHQMRETAKLESLGLLAGGIAHDFNNLLTGVMANASLALTETVSNEISREALKDVILASQRAAELTRQMLEYAGRGRFVLSPVNLSVAVDEITTLVRTSIPKVVNLDLQLGSDLPFIEADRSQMEQLVMNFVINAAEAIGEGRQGRVSVRTTAEDIQVLPSRFKKSGDGFHPGKYVMLQVSDNGSGMDEATQAKIFDPFFTTKFTGRGLGLAAVSGIVRAHHGFIDVESSLGRGTTFKVIFPALHTKPAPPPKVEAPMELHGKGLVLVVDDEETVLRVASSSLKRYGYNVLSAANGQIALDVLQAHLEDVDLVILDLTMPVMGGEEALESIKLLRPDLPVVLSTGYDQAEASRRFHKQDLKGFLQKPYTAQKLLEAVKMALAKPT